MSYQLLIYEYMDVIISIYLSLIILILYYLINTIINYTANINQEYSRTKSEINSVINNISKQISNINIRLTDMDSELGKISEKVLKIEGGRPIIKETHPKGKVSQASTRYLTSRTGPLTSRSQIELTGTQKIIIDELKKGPRTYKEIQSETKLSREHISRELKKLYEMGILERDESKKPFVYMLKS